MCQKVRGSKLLCISSRFKFTWINFLAQIVYIVLHVEKLTLIQNSRKKRKHFHITNITTYKVYYTRRQLTLRCSPEATGIVSLCNTWVAMYRPKPCLTILLFHYTYIALFDFPECCEAAEKNLDFLCENGDNSDDISTMSKQLLHGFFENLANLHSSW